ncbi:MAG: 30S ribosomal protein S16 [Propionibacteriaceae bacterium]|nr:30S ribosomal protein S16 [Propionibacteriaceae bacterium]
MAVKIRLKRLGKIRQPYYRIVVMDSRTKRDGRAIEEIGLYHPKNEPSLIQVDSERALYWLGVGAQPTEAVVAILKRTGDWQKFTGSDEPAGVDPQPVKPDKVALFNAALAEADDAPTSSAFTRGRGGKGKAEEAPVAAPEPEDEAPAPEPEPEPAPEPEPEPEPEAPAEEPAAEEKPEE